MSFPDPGLLPSESISPPVAAWHLGTAPKFLPTFSSCHMACAWQGLKVLKLGVISQLPAPPTPDKVHSQRESQGLLATL